MTPREAASLLAIAGAYDQRLTPPSQEDAKARAVAWSAALDTDMPVEWARQQVTRHYAERTTVLMPADINTAWRVERRDMKRRALEDQRRLEIEASRADAVPMPDWVREQMRNIGTGSKV